LYRAGRFVNFELRDVGFLPSVNHFSGLMQINALAQLGPQDITDKKNGGGNRDAEWNFCRGKEADISLFLQVTRSRKIRKIFETN